MLLSKIEEFRIPVVAAYGTIKGNINEYVARQVKLEGREGDIIRFADGHMCKLKNEWYVRIHKTKDLIRAERIILDIIINEQLDDVLPILDEADLKTVRDYEQWFWQLFNGKLGQLEGLLSIAKVLCGTDKKKLALEYVPNLKQKDDAKYMFLGFDGKNLRDLMIEKVKASVGNTTRYDEMIAWMKG